MRHRVLLLSLSFTVLSAVLAIGWSAYRTQQTDELVAGARTRLYAPFDEAPGLDRLSASTAASLLERARELGREDPEVLGLLAFAHALEDYQRGDLLLAERELTTARDHLGNRVELRVLGAAVARGRSLPNDAAIALADALQEEPDNLHANLLACDIAIDDGDGPGALRHLAVVLDAYPDVSPLHNRAGLAHEINGRLDRAEVSYLRAVELDSRSQEGLINLGRLHRHRGQHQEALADFERAVAVADTDPDAHLGRGLSRAALGDLDGAQVDFARAAELAPNDAEPLLALGDLQRDTRRYDEAVATYRAAIAREEGDAASWLKLGNVLVLLEDYADAASAFRSALGRVPELAPALNGLGASLMHLGQTEEAVIALARAAELSPTDPNPFMNLALLYERTGDTAHARDAWMRALERDPGSAIAEARLARLSQRG